MNNKLLCIDPLQDYTLIDVELLRKQDIEVIFVYKTTPDKKTLLNNHLLIESFTYEYLYSTCASLLPDYIVCFSEDLFVDIANIRAKLKIKGMDLAKAQLLSHKNLMYEAIDGYFPYPTTALIYPTSDFEQLKNALNSKEIFIKPINGAGSYETYHIKNNSEYQQFLLSKKEHVTNYIAQAYINSDLYHSELVIANNEILFCSARKYSMPNHLMVSNNIPIFSLNIIDSDAYNTIINASRKITQLLGVSNGILHTEFFMDKQKKVHFIETNARAPGIGLNTMYWNKLSLSLETVLCFIVCEKVPPKFVENPDHYICGYYPIKPGVVKNIITPSLDVQNEWVFFVKPNDSLEQVKHMSKSAMFVCWDKCINQLEKSQNTLLHHNVIEVY